MRLSLLLALVALFLSPLAVAAESVRIAGTASSVALLQKLDSLPQRAYPHRTLSSSPAILGSNGSLRAVAAGRIDLAIVGRPPGPDEGHFEVTAFAATPLVLASHSKVGRQQLSRRELLELFAGQRRHWPDGERIRLVLRAPFESDVATLRTLDPGIGPAIEASVKNKVGPVAENDLDAIELLARLPGSFGSTTLGLMQTLDIRLTTHAIDGIAPSTSALESGHYPLSKRFFLVTRPTPDAATAEYVAFLKSKPVQEFLRRFDYVPARE